VERLYGCIWEKRSRDVVGGNVRDVLHPSVQAGQYMTYLTDCHTAFQGEHKITAHACSYLHNYNPPKDDPLFLPQFAEQMKQLIGRGINPSPTIRL